MQNKQKETLLAISKECGRQSLAVADLAKRLDKGAGIYPRRISIKEIMQNFIKHIPFVRLFRRKNS